MPVTIRDMKLRSFIPPGATLHLEAGLKQHAHESLDLNLETRAAKQVIVTAGLVFKAGDTV
jgi:hypothetical protein